MNIKIHFKQPRPRPTIMQRIAVARLLKSSKQHYFSGLVNAAAFHTTQIAMIQKGDKIPKVELYEGTNEKRVDIQELVKGKKTIIFGVPGAFTPICSNIQLPSFVKDAPELRERGVEEIICVSVNDPWVMKAWGDAHKAGQAGIRCLADMRAEFTKAIEMDFDKPEIFGSVRSKRYWLYLDDGEVMSVDVEPDDTGMSCTDADTVLKKL